MYRERMWVILGKPQTVIVKCTRTPRMQSRYNYLVACARARASRLGVQILCLQLRTAFQRLINGV